MGDEIKKTIPRIRTYASDFEHDKKEGGLPAPTDGTPPTPIPQKSTSAISKVANDISKIIEEEKLPVTETHVPAFHEIQKRHSTDTVTITNKVAATKPVVSSPQTQTEPAKTVIVRNTKPAQSAASATIITDNKRAKQQLFPALIASIQAWFKAISTTSKQKSAPKYTVSDTERRKGVIQKATTKSGAIFTADSETLKDEILRRKWEQAVPDSHETDISWSPNTEVGYPLLKSGPTAPSAVVVSFKQNTTKEVAEAKVVEPVPVTSVPPPVFVEPSVPETITILETAPPTIYATATNPPVSTPLEVPAASQIERPTQAPNEQYALTTPEAHYRIKSIGDVTKLNTNILSVGVVGVIAGIVIVIVVGQALIGIILEQAPQNQIVSATPISHSTSVTDIALSTPTQEALIIALQQANSDGQIQQEFRITDSSGTPLQKQTLLSLLGFASTGSLGQSINDLRIIQIGSARGIIFTVNDPTTAFGSLLAGESSMVNNFSSILSISAQQETTLVSDRTLQNIDVRVFTANNQEVLVYGFINDNTVLITKDVPSFTTALASQ